MCIVNITYTMYTEIQYTLQKLISQLPSIAFAYSYIEIAYVNTLKNRLTLFSTWVHFPEKKVL